MQTEPNLSMSATLSKTARKPSLAETRGMLEEADRLRRAGRLDEAQKLCETLLQAFPDYVGALHTLGLVLAGKRQYKQAQIVLSEAANLNPRDWVVLTALSTVYLQTGANEMAARTLEQALKRKPDDAGVLATLGEIYREEKEYELAADASRRATQADPGLSAGWLGLGASLTYLGELAGAAEALEELVNRDAASVTCLYSLSQLPKPLVGVDLLPLLDKASPELEVTKGMFEITRDFGRAAALNSAGRVDESWETLVKANWTQFKQVEKRYRDEVAKRRSFLARAPESPIITDPGEPVEGVPLSLFIFGPSRCGKTTLEQLLGTLDGVKRGYENPILRNTARRASQIAGLPTRNTLLELPMGLDALGREQYVEELKERSGSALVFTNTHPGHISDTYRMATMLPNVRFVFMKRNMDDIMLRIFGKLYSSGNFYSYDLHAAREYVQWYYDVIDALAELLPTISMTVVYDDMVADPKRTLEAVVDFCGIKAAPRTPIAVGDDSGCAEPYADLMRATLVD